MKDQTVNQELLDFFDAMDEKNYDRMLECLTKLQTHATQKELDDICMVLDIHPPVGCDDAWIPDHVHQTPPGDDQKV